MLIKNKFPTICRCAYFQNAMLRKSNKVRIPIHVFPKHFHHTSQLDIHKFPRFFVTIDLLEYWFVASIVAVDLTVQVIIHIVWYWNCVRIYNENKAFPDECSGIGGRCKWLELIDFCFSYFFLLVGFIKRFHCVKLINFCTSVLLF